VLGWLVVLEQPFVDFKVARRALTLGGKEPPKGQNLPKARSTNYAVLLTFPPFFREEAADVCAAFVVEPTAEVCCGLWP